MRAWHRRLDSHRMLGTLKQRIMSGRGTLPELRYSCCGALERVTSVLLPAISFTRRHKQKHGETERVFQRLSSGAAQISHRVSLSDTSLLFQVWWETPGDGAGPGSRGLAARRRPLCSQRKITARHLRRSLSDVISGERHVFPCHCGQMTRACGAFKIS
ncbi:hypothetical protein FB567DRAFT_25975 [Paraphoma chrysanthemicola]|uniref:Uncharacterized protein n=1 Tax=Paraphoma chrysanthemicola TaxID=798071 RepID=A0A8K0RIW1_9PLEO|nr:hypothetical protein FB567DRAFT_25975 [Paraphoma chrysanthemicola]